MKLNLIAACFLLILFLTPGVAGANQGKYPGPGHHLRIVVVLENGPDYQRAFQDLDAKPEIQLLSWNGQTGIAELSADPRVTPALLTDILIRYKIKVASITPIQP